LAKAVDKNSAECKILPCDPVSQPFLWAKDPDREKERENKKAAKQKAKDWKKDHHC
jgi:hypothetical protein